MTPVSFADGPASKFLIEKHSDKTMCLEADSSVRLFAKTGSDSIDEVGEAILSGAGMGSKAIRRTLHSHRLPSNEEEDLVVVTAVKLLPDKGQVPFPYTFRGPEDPPKRLCELFRHGMYPWDTRMMILSSDPALGKGNAHFIGPSSEFALQKTHRDHSGTAATFTSDDSAADKEEEAALHEEGKEVAIRSYEKSLYFSFETELMLHQMQMPPHLLRTVKQSHVRELEKRFLKDGYDYSNGLMSLTVRRAENNALESLGLDEILERKGECVSAGNPDKFRVLHSNLKAITVDGAHRHQSLMNIAKREHELECVSKPIRVRLILRKDGKDMTSTELLNLGSKRNQASATICPFQSLEDYIYAVMSYLSSFAEEVGISVLDVRPSNIAAEMAACDLIEGLKPGTYRRYVRIAKLFLKHPRAFETLKSVDPERRPRIGAVHLDHQPFHEVDEHGVLLFIQSVSGYVRHPDYKGAFKGREFFCCAKEMYMRYLDTFEKFGVPQGFSFSQFLSTEIPLTKTKTISLSQLFVNNMCLFSNNERLERERSVARCNRLVSRIKLFFEPKAAESEVKQDASTRPQHSAHREDQRGPVRRNAKRNARERKISSYVPQTSPRRAKIVLPHKRKRRVQANATNTAPEALDLTSSSDSDVRTKGNNIPRSSLWSFFDDFVPVLRPHGHENIDMFEGEKDPWWQCMTSASPAVVDNAFHHLLEKDVEVNHSQWLRGLHIPNEHRAHLYANIGSLSYLHRLVWLIGCKKVLEASKAKSPEIAQFLQRDDWSTALKQYKTGLGSSFFLEKEHTLNEKGFCVFEGLADCKEIPEYILSELKCPSNLTKTSLSELFSHYENTFPGEEVLKNHSKLDLWNFITNLKDENRDKELREKGIGRFSSTRALVMERTELSADTVWASIRRAFLDVWVGQLAVLIGIRNTTNEKSWVPKTGGRFLFTGKDCPRQVPHNDFPCPPRGEKGNSTGYFILVTGRTELALWVCDYSHNFVLYPIRDLERLGKTLKLRRVVVPPFSVVFGHGFLTHSEGGQCCSDAEQSVRYHMYFVPEGKALPDRLFQAFPVVPKFDDEDVFSMIEKEIGKGIRKPDVSKQAVKQIGDEDTSSSDQNGGAVSDVDMLENRREGSVSSLSSD